MESQIITSAFQYNLFFGILVAVTSAALIFLIHDRNYYRKAIKSIVNKFEGQIELIQKSRNEDHLAFQKSLLELHQKTLEAQNITNIQLGNMNKGIDALKNLTEKLVQKR